MDLQAFRTRHPRWASFLHLSGATAAMSGRRHARALMSLGSLGMFVTALYGLLVAVVLSLPGRADNSTILRWAGLDASRLTQVPPALAVGSVLLLAATAFACFFMVRRLGSALATSAQPSLAIAARLRWLARLLALNLLANLVLPACLDGQGWNGLGFSTALLPSLIGIYLCYALAERTRAGASAADENRGFV